MADIHPLALLKDTLRTEETEIRLKSLVRLVSISAALDPERIRDELIPVLVEFVDGDVEDECLLKLAEQLGTEEMIELIGGSEHVKTLFPIFEKLAGIEETVVRTATCNAICVAFSHVLDADAGDALEMVKRLSVGAAPDNWYTSRVSTCTIIPSLYPRSKSVQNSLLDLYTKLSSDETPMVRRSAAQNLPFLCDVVTPEVIINKVLPIFNTLINSQLDSVKQITIEHLHKLAESMSAEQVQQHILPHVRACCEEKSWRLRQAIAMNFSSSVKQMPTEILCNEVAGHLRELIKDNEADVRSLAVKTLIPFFSLIDIEIFKDLFFDLLKDIVVYDVNPSVRLAGVKVLMELAIKLPEDVCELVVQLLSMHDSGEVHVVILDNLSNLKHVSEDSIKNKLLPALVELEKNPKWRIREGIINGIPSMCKGLDPSYFDESLLEIYSSAMVDPIYAVRTSAANSMKELCEVFGDEWATSRFIPRLTGVWDKAGSYIEKITMLYAFRALASSAQGDVLMKEILPRVMKGCKDKTPNVKCVAVQTLQELIPSLDDLTLTNQVRPCLEEMQRDEDSDVQYYSSLCIDTMKH